MAIRLKPVKPSRKHLIRITVIFNLIRHALKFLFSPYLRLEVEGAEHVPKRGRILVLSNHVGFLDPYVVCIATGRMVQFMATPTLFTRPILGAIVKFFGVVPKRKFYADLSSIFRLVEWARLGSSVGLFPEGQRTWDAHTLDIVPGIGKLVRLIDSPVVLLRMYNMDRVSPRWAVFQRKGHIIVQIDKPIRFDRKTRPEEIEREIQKRLYVDPLTSPPALTYGKNRAVGISNVLFLCPHCYAFESIRENRNDIRCETCGATWQVGANNILNRVDKNESIPLISAIDCIRAYMKERNYIIDQNRFDRDDVALESNNVQLYEISGRRPRLIGEGNLQLTKYGLHLDGDAKWEILWQDLLVATVDLRTDLQFRSNSGLYGAVLRDESVVKWEWFSNFWLQQANNSR